MCFHTFLVLVFIYFWTDCVAEDSNQRGMFTLYHIPPCYMGGSFAMVEGTFSRRYGHANM